MVHHPFVDISAITLDLDDTLWPVWPSIERAEVKLHAWLTGHLPKTAAAFDTAGLRRLRDRVALQRPEWSHDLSAIRLESLRDAMRLSGDDPAQAEAAFAVFIDARQRVDLYPDVSEALARLAARHPLIALTNGNASLERIGLAEFFEGSVTAREFGVGKPAPEIFHEACRRLARPPDAVLHVGDDLLLDVAGAVAAGMPAAWIQREDQLARGGVAPADTPTFPTLAALADALRC